MFFCCHVEDFWKEVYWIPSVLDQKKVQLMVLLTMHDFSQSTLGIDSHAVLTDKRFQHFCEKNTEIMFFSLLLLTSEAK